MKALIKSLFTKNIPLKLVALTVALLLWFYVITDKQYEYKFHFKLQAENLEKKYIWTTDGPDSVEVRLSGPGKSLLLLMLNERNVYFDAGSYKPEKGVELYRKIEINEEKFEIPYDDIKILEITQPRDKKIGIKVQMIDQRMIPISSRLEILPSSGYFVTDDITFTPSEVLVVGPSGRLYEIDSIYTLKDTIDGLKATTSRTVLLDTTVAGVSFEERYVSASIPIDHLSYKNLRQIPIKLRGFPEGFQIVFEPRTIDITISGSSATVEKVNNTDIRIYLDYKQLSPEGNKIEPIISHPPDVSITDKKPEYIEIKERSEIIDEVIGNGN